VRFLVKLKTLNPIQPNHLPHPSAMPNTIEIPLELTHFQLPEAVQDRLQALLDRQDAGEGLTPSEQQEAAGLVELSEFLSLLHLRAQRVTGQA